MFSNAPGRPAPQPGKVYTIKGTTWIQEPMEYYTFLKALDLLRGRFEKFFAGEASAADLFDTVISGPVVPQVVHLVLRPHAKTPWGWALNRVRILMAGIDRDNPAASMTLQEVSGVVLDFFDLNISWIAAWIEALMKSFTSTDQAKATAEDGTTPLLPKNLFLSLLGEILRKPPPSGDKTP